MLYIVFKYEGKGLYMSMHVWTKSFRVIVWTVSAVGVLLLWALRPGIRYLTVFAILHWVLIACLGVNWRHTFCEILTRYTQRIRDLLIMRYINLHFSMYLFWPQLQWSQTKNN